MTTQDRRYGLELLAWGMAFMAIWILLVTTVALVLAGGR